MDFLHVSAMSTDNPMLAHIAENVGWSTGSMLLAIGVVCFAIALMIQHAHVKHGKLSLRALRVPVASLAAVATVAVVAPTPSIAQSTVGPMGLPDLISDPPFIWIERDLTDPLDGEVMRVLSFDSFLHNIGTGALEVSGNPQVEGGVKQRVFNGQEWEEVGEPWVQFETDDGHNHFHLMNAAAYTLWNEGQTEQVELGAKVGFCLVDTAQVERGAEDVYNIADTDYCNVDEPDSTDLRMGISPGWVDIYDSTITFQWVDVSNTPPGRYWVGALIDPTDQIVESNEDNNVLTFSANKYAVSGYVARELDVQTGTEIELKADVYGTVGQVAYVVVEPPTNGTLSVPTGVDVLDPIIQYTPDPGSSGADSFSYYAHDTNTPFPFDAEVVTVQIEATGALATDTPSDPLQPAEGRSIELGTSTVPAERYERVELQAELSDAEGLADGTSVRWYGRDLPPGITIDVDTGLIEGELTQPGDTQSTIVARINAGDGGADMDLETPLDWTVEDRNRRSLRSINDISTELERRDILVGAGTAETSYRATGLPEGLTLSPGQPSILGTPTEAGVFDVTVDELRGDEVVDSVSFTFTVRPAARPEFAL